VKRPSQPSHPHPQAQSVTLTRPKRPEETKTQSQSQPTTMKVWGASHEEVCVLSCLAFVLVCSLESSFLSLRLCFVLFCFVFG
jgi:hypothetical protein